MPILKKKKKEMPAKDEISYFRLLIVHPPFLKEHALETKGKKCYCIAKIRVYKKIICVLLPMLQTDWLR